jgi:hypothetical protein
MCPNPGPEPNRHRTSPLLAGCGPGGRGFESRRSPQSGLACKAAHTAASRQVRSPPRRCVHGARLLRNALVAPADLAYRNSRKALLPREARAPLPAGERSRDARTSVYARHGGCRRRRRDRRDRVLYLIPLRASRFRGVGSVEAGSAANNLGPRAVLRQHAPSATRQRTLGANGIDCGASVVTPRAERLALGAPSKAPEKGPSIGVAALASVLRVSVRGRLVAPARLFRFLGRGITGARRLLAFALFPIVASAELCCLFVGQDVLPS